MFVSEPQLAVLRAIRDLTERDGVPSYQAIANHIGQSARSNARRHVIKLEGMGLVLRKRRGPVLTDAGRTYLSNLEPDS